MWINSAPSPRRCTRVSREVGTSMATGRPGQCLALREHGRTYDNVNFMAVTCTAQVRNIA